MNFKKILTTAMIGVSTLGAVGLVSSASADTVNGDGTVTVQSGDTLWGIAQKHNTSVAQLQNENHLSSDLIYVGQNLKVDGSNVTYTVPTNTQSVATTTTTNTVNPATESTQNTQNVAPVTTSQAQAINNNNDSYTSNVSGDEAAAKAWIANKESSNNYNARNGNYVGKFQLSSAYLNGDYSPANQERTADQYVKDRYGSWTAAMQFHQAHGYY